MSNITGPFEVNHVIPTMEVQTQYQDPMNASVYLPLTTGRHSTLNVDLSVAGANYYYVSDQGTGVDNELYYSSIIVTSSEGFQTAQKLWQVRKRCVNGSAQFSDISINKSSSGLKFNFTQTLPYYPWDRWPPIYQEQFYYYFSNVVYLPFPSANRSPGVAYTNILVFEG